MPNTPFHVAHEANLHAMTSERPAEAGAQPITTARDGKAEAMLRASTETGMTQAAGEIAALEAVGTTPSPVRVVPSGLWRPKAIAAALRGEGMGSLTETQDITAFMFGFRNWRELARAATKGRADPPDEQCGAEEVCRRRAHQAYALDACSNMGPVAAAIAVDALQPTTKAGRPVLDLDTLARMRAASREHAEAQIEDELGGEDEWDDLGEFDADSTGREDTDAVDRILAAAGIGPNADPLDVIDALQRTPSIDSSVWSPVLEKRFGWAVTETDEDVDWNDG